VVEKVRERLAVNRNSSKVKNRVLRIFGPKRVEKNT
jgi:hypothetical protein